jgi:hypothetical protein
MINQRVVISWNEICIESQIVFDLDSFHFSVCCKRQGGAMPAGDRVFDRWRSDVGDQRSEDVRAGGRTGKMDDGGRKTMDEGDRDRRPED